jgi:alpha,alpha-trehalase
VTTQDQAPPAHSSATSSGGSADGRTATLGSPQVLREYALLADGERGALLGPRGDIAWMCAPRWDSAAVFAGLLGAPGHYDLTPTERYVWGGHYEDGSLIWRSRWMTDDGPVESREALALPADTTRLVLLRRVLADDVPASVHVVLDPRGDYGRHPLTALHRDDEGCWTGRIGDLRMRWRGGGDAVLVTADGGTRLELDLVVPSGRHHDLVLEIGPELPDRAPDPDLAWRETESRWHASVPPSSRLIGAAPRDAAQAAAVLRGMTSGSGAMVAAATTSLPERPGGRANFDYRYTWIRDQCYAGRAAALAGLDDLLDDAVRFLGARLLEDGPRLAPAYTIDGGPVPDEVHLGVPGYPGGGDRVGNRGGHQFQLDAFGELLLLLASAAERGRLDAEGWRAVETAVDAIEQRWTQPDAGVWELEDREWTHSRLVCVAGLRAVAATTGAGTSGGALGGGAGLAGRWSALADTILAHTARTSTHPSGRWQRAADDPRPDGALLLAAVRGAVPADDPRSRATLEAYLRELTSDGYAYRFRADERPLGDAEGAFLLCNFIAALACQQQGDALCARHFFERGRSACGPPGLLTEEFDVTQRQLRGNLPQAFVHALLLEASTVLAPLEAGPGSTIHRTEAR